MSPDFLRLDEVLALHKEQISLYGGTHGVRDMGLLLSALAMPAASFGSDYLHATRAEQAAAYLFHVTSNHPFVDGNKRTGLAAAIAFLLINDVTLTAQPRELEALVMRVASGEASKAEVAVFLEHNSQPAG